LLLSLLLLEQPTQFASVIIALSLFSPPEMSETNTPKMVSAVWVMTVIAPVFPSLRIAVKRRFHKQVGWDDYFLVFSWVRQVCYTSEFN